MFLLNINNPPLYPLYHPWVLGMKISSWILQLRACLGKRNASLLWIRYLLTLWLEGIATMRSLQDISDKKKKRRQSALKITRSYPTCDSVLANSKFQDLILCKTHPSMYQTTLIMCILQSNETLWRKCPLIYIHVHTKSNVCLGKQTHRPTGACTRKWIAL